MSNYLTLLKDIIAFSIPVFMTIICKVLSPSLEVLHRNNRHFGIYPISLGGWVAFCEI